MKSNILQSFEPLFYKYLIFNCSILFQNEILMTTMIESLENDALEKGFNEMLAPMYCI